MKFRNQFLKYKMHSNTADGDGGGGGGGDGKSDAENNSEGDLLDHDNLWDNDAPATETPASSAVQKPAAQAISAAESFDNHVAGIDFGTDPQALMTAMREGDLEAFTTQMQNLQVGIYKAGMLDANKMMQQTSGNLKTELQQNTDTTISSNKIISEMNEKLPYTAEPAYAPMAKAVISRLLSKKGMTPAKAIEETGKYFSGMASKVAGNMVGKLPNVSGNQFVNESQTEEVDWVSFMGGKPE